MPATAQRARDSTRRPLVFTPEGVAFTPLPPDFNVAPLGPSSVAVLLRSSAAPEAGPDPPLPVVGGADRLRVEEDAPRLRRAEPAVNVLQRLDQGGHPAVAVVGVGVADKQVVSVPVG